MKNYIYACGYAGKEDNIVVYEQSSGLQLYPVESYVSSPNPSMMVKSNNILYVANEMEKSSIDSYRIDESGKLKFIERIETGYDGLCHMCLSQDGSVLIGVHYFSGNVIVVDCNKKGNMRISQVIFRYGSSINLERQEASHLHSVNFIDDGKNVMVCDLGADELIKYEVDYANKVLCYSSSQPVVNITQGEGPRFSVLHPSGKWLYLVTELLNNIHVYNIDEATMQLENVQTISSLPNDFDGESFAADIKISEDGKYLYVSNRGHNTIGVYKIKIDGKLTRLDYFDTFGVDPRYFDFGKDEKSLIIAHQTSGNVVVLKRNSENGLLSKEWIDNKYIGSATCVLKHSV